MGTLEGFYENLNVLNSSFTGVTEGEAMLHGWAAPSSPLGWGGWPSVRPLLLGGPYPLLCGSLWRTILPHSCKVQPHSRPARLWGTGPRPTARRSPGSPPAQEHSGVLPLPPQGWGWGVGVEAASSQWLGLGNTTPPPLPTAGEAWSFQPWSGPAAAWALPAALALKLCK